MQPYYLYCLDFPNGKKYIGITKNPKERLYKHSQAAKGNRTRQRVSDAITKHGMPPIRIMCIGMRKYITALEAKAIDLFQTRNPDLGYNVAVGGDHNPMSDETRAKIGMANSGRKLSPEHRAKLSAARQRRVITPETRAKLSASGKIRHQKNPLSDEARARIRAANIGRKASAEARANMSKAHKGQTMTPEARAKLSVANKGKKLSPEHVAKVIAALKGGKRSAEARANMRAGWARWREFKRSVL